MSSKGASKRIQKEAYFEKLKGLLDEYHTIFIVNVDNVGSNQMHQIRMALRGEALILMGKNTMVRKVLKNLETSRPELQKLLPVVRGNVGFVFTKGDLKTIRDKITSNRVRAPAKAGVIAPSDVFVPAGNTGMGPEKTSFFQALGIATKIARGTIEIINEVHLIKPNDKVGASEAALLNMLEISPFTYGLSIVQVYDQGNCFPPSVLDIGQETMIKNLMAGISNVAAISLATGYLTTAAVPHLMVQGYKNLIASSLASTYVIEGAKKLKELLDNPEALAALKASSAPAAAPAGSQSPKKDAKKEAKVEEKEESDDDMGFGLFD